MKFTKQEVATARQLKQLGLPWEPNVGHYVRDEAGIINCESPFGDSVFFILDLKHFLRRAGTIENIKRDLCWLPTWFDARTILHELDVPDDLIVARLQEALALEKGVERLCLYQLIEESLINHPNIQPIDNFG